MRKRVLPVLLIALLASAAGLVPAQAASAAEPKPFAVAAIASYDEIMADLNWAGELAGEANVAKRVEALVKFFTQDKGLAGLNKKKPLGAVVFATDDQPVGCALIPVTDFDKLLDVVEPFAKKIEELDSGALRIEGDGPTIFVKHQNGWAIASDKHDVLALAPANPAKWLAPLVKQYDAAISFNARGVPAKLRKQLISQIKKEAAKGESRLPGETDELYALRKRLMASAVGAITTAINDLESVTIGWSLDRKAKTASAELAVTARKGSKMARAMAQLAGAETAFGGFLMDEAAITAHLTGDCPFLAGADFGAAFAAGKKEIFKQIDADVPDEHAEAAKDLIEGLLEVAEETIATGRIDGAASVILEPDAATLVAGRHLADGRKLEAVLGRALKAARKEHAAIIDKHLKVDADECCGVSFHVITIPIPPGSEDAEQAVQLLGEKLQIVGGFGKEAVYVAVGKDALKTLKQAIGNSSEPKAVVPAAISVSLSKIANVAAELSEGPQKEQAQIVASMLAEAEGKDHLSLSAVATDRGVKLRVEIEGGVLSLMKLARQQ